MPSTKRRFPRRGLAPALLLAALLAGCAGLRPGGPLLPPDLAKRPDGATATGWPPELDAVEAKARIAGLIDPSVKDRDSWAGDMQAAFASLDIVHATETYCAVIAVTAQESGFNADPVVPGIGNIVRRELNRRADKYGIPRLLVAAALKKGSPDGRSYEKRIDTLRTERQLSALFEDMSSELPFGRKLLAGFNPVHTAGPMQVSVKFAEQHVRERDYPWPIERELRDEVFTRRGGLYFGSAMLLGYPAPYDDAVFRFADYNAGRYASRNAAFQAALARWSGRPVDLDGDLLRYRDGEPAETPGQVETLLRSASVALDMSAAEIRRDLLLEKTAEFGETRLYERLFALADSRAGEALPRQRLPEIKLNSPKFQRKLTTGWFARRVADRYKACLERGG